MGMNGLRNMVDDITVIQVRANKGFVHLIYCDVIYHILQTVHPHGGITLNCQMERVEQIQYQAALAVTGAWQGTDRVKL